MVVQFAAPSSANLAGSYHITPVVRLLIPSILIGGVRLVRTGANVRYFRQVKLIQANFAHFMVNIALAILLWMHRADPYGFAGGQLAAAVVTGILLSNRSDVPFEIAVVRRRRDFWRGNLTSRRSEVRKIMQAKQIYRRLKREKERLLSIFFALRDPLINLVWDRYRDHWIHVYRGCLPASSNIALFIVYQPHGVSEETYASLVSLRRAGFAPVVVFNHPVPEQDRVRIAEYAHLFCFRPNLGYDFGGYRDGLYVIGRYADAVENLIVANDSTVFPLFGDVDFIAHMMKRDGSFVAVTSSEGVEGYRTYDRACADQERGLPPMPGRYCACSYFLLFKDHPLDDPVFVSFWSSYHMTSSKRQTILRGEIGLTRHFRRHGVEPTVLYNVPYIANCVAAIETERLPEALSGLDFLWKTWEGERDRLLYRAAEGMPGWADDARRFILLSILNRNVLDTARHLNDNVFRIPFRKKNLRVNG